MISYSQNNEQSVILNYFGDRVGVFADFGCNDGRTLSNTRQLALQGWSGILCDVSGVAMLGVLDLYRDDNKYKLFNFAVTGNYEGVVDLYEGGEHLGIGDTSLLTTINKSELDRWAGTNNHFVKTSAYGMPVNKIIELSGFDKIDFISIDIEGSDLEVLKQINLTKLGCRCVCIEWNNNVDVLAGIIEHCSRHELIKQLVINPENVIFALP